MLPLEKKRCPTIRKYSLFILLVFSIGCVRPTHDRNIERGFYYWKTKVQLNHFEDSIITALQGKYLYIRFFDVDLSPDGKSVKPIAVADFNKTRPQQKIVPVVFITTRALHKMTPTGTEYYAKNIAALLEKKCKEISTTPDEIQIDCDWTTANKETYFEFLRNLKKQAFLSNKLISATIRLYQEKYIKEAGIPPVDKGLLMVYNMDKLTDFNAKNSIISIETAKKYLDYVTSYPLHLDVALPIYSWTLLFDNAGLQGILRDVGAGDLKNNSIFRQQSGNRFLVKCDTLYKGYQLKKGSVIRYENSSFETLNSVAQYLSGKIRQDSFRVLLYHADSLNLSNYTVHELEKIYTDFN